MVRSLVVAVLAVGLVAGCVSIAPTTQTPGTVPPAPSVAIQTPAPPTILATPVASPTPSPTPTPTSAPAVTPIALPTPQATTPPTTPPSAGPSPAGVENYGATTPLFDDNFDDPNSGWGVGANGGGTVAYGDSTLEIDTASTGAWELSRRLAGSTSNAVHLETVFTPSGAGYQGLLCANSDDQLWGAAANGDGMYVFIKVDADGPSVLSQGQLDGLRTPSAGTSRFALDCAGTATGSFRMQIDVGNNIGVQYFAAVDEGPSSFDRAGIYAESSAEPYSLSVDYVIAFGGTGDTSMSPAAKELMTHVPADWQPNCFEGLTSFFAVGGQGDILCQLDSGRSDWAEYTSFDTTANMDGYFQYLVDKWAVPEQGQNCDTGPHQGGYSIGGQPAGKIMCGPSVTGTQFVWTTDDLLIASQLIDLEGSYPDMYADWLIAGPS